MWISKYSNLASLVVGITFIFSGVVKLNDPRSFAYKIEEYLHLWASQITVHVRRLLPYTPSTGRVYGYPRGCFRRCFASALATLLDFRGLTMPHTFFYVSNALYRYFETDSELRMFW